MNIEQAKFDGFRHRYARDASVVALILSNVVPIAGVLFWEWDVTTVILLYWAENLIIGVFTLLKLISLASMAAILYSAFFAFHYAAFCAIHGFFLLLLVAHQPVPFQIDGAFFFAFHELLLEVIAKVLQIAPPAWLFGFAGLAVSHGVSLVWNYFIQDERAQSRPANLMFAPYKRVVLLHVALIVGGMALMALESPMPLLLLLIAGKTLLDLLAHRRAHARLAGGTRHTARRALPSQG